MTGPAPEPQRRGRSIAMSGEEVSAFLDEQRTCRVATIGTAGPHVAPLWFVWDGAALWLYSIVASQRWTDVQRDPRVAVVVDAGESYGDLRGVEIRGLAEAVGEIPRTGTPDPSLEVPEKLFAHRYQGASGNDPSPMVHDGRHGWLRITPSKITSWDFRKLARSA